MPNRILRESVCVSDTIDQLTWFEEVLYYRLIVNCDDFGRFDGRAAVIKNRLFPLKDTLTLKTVEAALHGLANAGLVTLYVFEGKRFLCLPTWGKYQTQRAKVSKYPAPDDGKQSDESICKQMIADVPVFENRESNSIFENREAGNARARRATPPREKFGQFGWVKLSKDEHSRLLKKLGSEELERCIAYIDEMAQSTGNKNEWKDWNLVVQRCSREGWGLRGKKTIAQKDNSWMDEFM